MHLNVPVLTNPPLQPYTTLLPAADSGTLRARILR